MQAFFCESCPLAFEIGSRVYWDLTGASNQLVCVKCGVMHKLDFVRAPDDTDYKTGTTRFYAWPEPIRTLSFWTDEFGFENKSLPYIPFDEKDWIEVKVFSNRPAFESLSCNYCGVTGNLISLEMPKNKNGSWPIFRDKHGNEHCPCCKKPIKCIYVDS